MNGELLEKIEDIIEQLKQNIEVHERNVSVISRKNMKGKSLTDSEHEILYEEQSNLRHANELLDSYERLHLYLSTQDHLTELYDAKKNEEDLKKTLVSEITEDFISFNDYVEFDKEKGLIDTLAYNVRYVDMDKLNEDLKTLKSNFVKEVERKEIYDYYFNLLETNINELYESEKVCDNLEVFEAKELKSSNRNLKIAAGVIGTAIGLIALIAALKSCSKEDVIDRNNTADNNHTTESTLHSTGTTEAPTTEEITTIATTTEETTTIEPTTLSENGILINALVKHGYPEDLAIKIVDMYNGFIIGELLATKYVDGINENFIIEYIEAMKLYNISFDKAVDYVNRAYEIQKTGFFEDEMLTINEIVAIVRSIDNKDLYTDENGALNQSIHTSFDRIMDNYIFGETTTKDIEKLEALKYFAKDNSDMDKFLTNFANISTSILNDQNDTEKNQKLTDYLYVFANSLGGFTNIDPEEPEKMKNIEEKYGLDFFKDAQVNDYHEWYILEQSFIGPLFNLTYHRESLFLDLFTIEGLYYSYNTIESRTNAVMSLDIDEKMKQEILYIFEIFRVRDAQYTAEASPEITALCGHSGYIRQFNGGE